LLYTVSEKKAE